MRDKLIPTGIYTVVVLETEIKRTYRGNQYIEALLEITSSGTYHGHRIFANFVFKPDNKISTRFFNTNIRAFGIDDFCLACPLPLLADELIGKTAQVHVTMREWGGCIFNEVVGVQPRQVLEGT